MTQPADHRNLRPLASCTSWCRADHNHDPACWGFETESYVNLSAEHGFPQDALPFTDAGGDWGFDPPRIGACAYRAQPGFREVVYLHLYRPHENHHLDLDVNVKLTADEARRLAVALSEVVEGIDGSL